MPQQTGARRLRAVRGGRRRRRQTAQEVLGRIAESTPPEGMGPESLDRWEPVLGHPLSVYEAILAAQAAQALAGDLRAAQFVRDTLGDKPGDAAEAAPEAMSPAERALVKKVASRLGLEDPLAE